MENITKNAVTLEVPDEIRHDANHDQASVPNFFAED
jgi:hypothetical protein